MFTAGIIVMLLGLFGIVLYAHLEDLDTEDTVAISFLAFIIICGHVLAIASIVDKQPVEKKLSNNALKIEIRQSLVNGVMINTDTVYIFTPKKND